ncbi:transcription factor bHLH147-like protein [Cinnamomum micranthum f. kanehirae]|uniref:Transcription factor bHLH147-like protein n=1 Tax=Cinnamomum micranthum f. kanehirae TaxID=337451 RepID=A0A3S3MSS1_9MAGN|nr:transcription factor bHLH147-like protein [Cinnamomum micranthum f. kanehirae]
MPLQSIETVTGKLTWNHPAQTKPETRWRTPAQQRIYGQRLLQALKSARTSSSSQPLAPSRAIKEAADSALALTAKGQTRWSRAILSRRWRTRKLLLKAGGKIRRRSSNPKRIGRPGLGLGSGSGSAADPRKGEEEKVRGRLRVLSRLVPGCRKLSTPTLLEEAADYVAALEMQVKAMRTLADLFSSATLSSGAES